MFFQCSAFLSRRTSPLLHLIIGPPNQRGSANHSAADKIRHQITANHPIQSVPEAVLVISNPCGGLRAASHRCRHDASDQSDYILLVLLTAALGGGINEYSSVVFTLCHVFRRVRCRVGGERHANRAANGGLIPPNEGAPTKQRWVEPPSSLSDLASSKFLSL
jgi:hypothetical protein